VETTQDPVGVDVKVLSADEAVDFCLFEASYFSVSMTTEVSDVEFVTTFT